MNMCVTGISWALITSCCFGAQTLSVVFEKEDVTKKSCHLKTCCPNSRVKGVPQNSLDKIGLGKWTNHVEVIHVYAED